ncbi:sulfite oxidase heme-binding subunit YedZ [Sulfitobacter mediterraneus]|uniref:sulfite oxidase heme-binding subunit YedZ n=1 Tax=Sulfitobacter mediterraneus TaxID=83219 RepID=UPI0021A4801F|nr:ferric reductase-like transmembrane domain-containing protein [Sulfitobacter mediterraneus]UWR09982.1 ferric reductase-like transmembrane domain-containing protein [Sulfitobacter mediterraneus]
MQRFFAATSPYLTWAVLASLGVMMTFTALTSDDPRIFHQLVHPSGETSARLLIVLMMATPLAMLLKGWRGPQWLKRNRRYLGVASFGYALLHTIFYLLDKASLSTVVDELPRLYIWTGWVAFLIFVPLALTSMDYFVRKMGKWWKWLQRWTYAAAVLTLVHWAALHDWKGAAPALVHFGPLIALEAYRVWYWYLRPRPQAAALPQR